MRRLSMIALVGGLAAAPVAAQPALFAPGFAPVADSRLAAVTSDGVAAFTLPDAFGRGAVEPAGSIAWEQLDNWFAEEGVDLIAANIARDSLAALIER